MDKKIKSCEIDVIARAKEYREPEVCWGKGCVTVSFYAFDPEQGFSTWMLGKSYIEQDPTSGIVRMKLLFG